MSQRSCYISSSTTGSWRGGPSRRQRQAELRDLPRRRSVDGGVDNTKLPLAMQFFAQRDREKAELCDPPRRRSVDDGDLQRQHRLSVARSLTGPDGARPADSSMPSLDRPTAAQGLALSTDSSARPLAADRCVHSVERGLRAVKIITVFFLPNLRI